MCVHASIRMSKNIFLRNFCHTALPFGRKLAPPVLVKETFSKFNLLPSVESSISNFGILVPTSAQTLAIPRLLKGESLLLVSQTGKGKTLAYLIPVVDSLLRSDTEGIFPVAHKPRVLIVVPTRELAVQTLKVVRSVFGSLVSSAAFAPGCCSFVKEKRLLNSGVDLIVTTPSRLELHINRGGIAFTHMQTLVVDEADTLCDPIYEKQVAVIVDKLATKKCQCIVVGATRTAAVNSFMQKHLPTVAVAVTSDAHLLSASLVQEFISIGRRLRTSALTEILQNSSSLKILIFVNSVRSCNFLVRFLAEHHLVENGATAIHGSMPYKIRRANYEKFTRGTARVLVCTNLASRGIDLGDVGHVIQYEFPDTLADYLHRAGRTARAGQTGKVTSLVTAKDSELMRQVQKSPQPATQKTHSKKNSKWSPLVNKSTHRLGMKLATKLGSPASRAAAVVKGKAERALAKEEILRKRRKIFAQR